MRAADEKRCASGTLALQEAEEARRDGHHSDAIDLTGDVDIGDFDIGDNLIILDDEPSGSMGPCATKFNWFPAVWLAARGDSAPSAWHQCPDQAATSPNQEGN